MSVGERLGTRPRYGSLPEHVAEREKVSAMIVICDTVKCSSKTRGGIAQLTLVEMCEYWLVCCALQSSNYCASGSLQAALQQCCW
jgi:hypothetical protein